MESGLTSASGRWMDWTVLRSCSRRAISSLCSAAVATASVTWPCSSAQRPVAKGRHGHQRGPSGALVPPPSASPTTSQWVGLPGSLSEVPVAPSPPPTAHRNTIREASRARGAAGPKNSLQPQYSLGREGAQVKDLGGMGRPQHCHHQLGEPGQPASLSRPHSASVTREKRLNTSPSFLPGCLHSSMPRGASGVTEVGKGTGGAVGGWG